MAKGKAASTALGGIGQLFSKGRGSSDIGISNLLENLIQNRNSETSSEGFQQQSGQNVVENQYSNSGTQSLQDDIGRRLLESAPQLFADADKSAAKTEQQVGKFQDTLLPAYENALTAATNSDPTLSPEFQFAQQLRDSGRSDLNNQFAGQTLASVGGYGGSQNQRAQNSADERLGIQVGSQVANRQAQTQQGLFNSGTSILDSIIGANRGITDSKLGVFESLGRAQNAGLPQLTKQTTQFGQRSDRGSASQTTERKDSTRKVNKRDEKYNQRSKENILGGGGANILGGITGLFNK